MGGITWHDILELIQTFIGGGIFLFLYQTKKDTGARKIANSRETDAQYVTIWSLYLSRPELKRVEDADANLAADPITVGEEVFVRILILHLATTFRAIEADEHVKFEGLRLDVRSFLSLPIPNAVWLKLKPFQDSHFVAFIDSVLIEENH